MTALLFIQYFSAGLFGIAFHILIKVKALKNRAEIANENFSLFLYLKKDWISVIISIVTVVIAAFIFDEVVRFRPAVADYVKFFFIAVGYMGSSVLQAVLSKSERQIMEVINQKTNVADKAIGDGIVTNEELNQVEKAQQSLTGK